MISELSKRLSKRDLSYLLEASYKALIGNSKEELHSMILKIQNMLEVNSIILSYGCGTTLNAELTDNLSLGVPEIFISALMSNHYYRDDPVILSSLQTGKVVDIKDHLQKNPTSEILPSVILAKEFGLISGAFLYVLTNSDNSSFLSFFGRNSYENSPKHQHLIIKYVTPFIALLFERLSIVTQQKNNIHCLTRRECEILNWLKEGKSSWEISMILHISESTVNFHITNIMRKLNVTKRTQAVAVAVQNKLIEF